MAVLAQTLDVGGNIQPTTMPRHYVITFNVFNITTFHALWIACLVCACNAKPIAVACFGLDGLDALAHATIPAKPTHVGLAISR